MNGRCAVYIFTPVRRSCAVKGEKNSQGAPSCLRPRPSAWWRRWRRDPLGTERHPARVLRQQRFTLAKGETKMIISTGFVRCGERLVNRDRTTVGQMYKRQPESAGTVWNSVRWWCSFSFFVFSRRRTIECLIRGYDRRSRFFINLNVYILCCATLLVCFTRCMCRTSLQRLVLVVLQ